jgi:hypothetical protein
VSNRRIRMEVLPARNPRGWAVTRSGKRVEWNAIKRRAVSLAVLIANQAARNGAWISLRIKRRDGTIMDERTYPRSSDPRRTKG